MITNKKNNKKKLTAAVRAAYEGHKSSTKKKEFIQEKLFDQDAMQKVSSGFGISTPENYVKQVTFEKEIALGKFFEKIITLSSTQGFVAFMMLYQFMYDKRLFGKEIDAITGQEIIDHIYKEKSYKLKPKNKQRLLCSIIKLSGLAFYFESKAETDKIRQIKGRETERAFTSFTLLDSKGYTTLADGETITSVLGVSIMKDFINICYEKLSKLYIPLDDVLQIDSDQNGDHRRGFNLSVALRHAELGHKKDYVEWDLEQCLNAGQWQHEKRRKSEAWNSIIDSLDAKETRPY